MDDSGLLLGKQVPVAEVYSPQLLYPIARARARGELGLDAQLPFHGCDLWHAYELSWLDGQGKPQVRVGRFFVPADSPAMIESKSFKLYLNSLNNTRFASDAEAVKVMAADLSRAAGAAIAIEILPVTDQSFGGTVPEGECLDALDTGQLAQRPARSLLVTTVGDSEATLYSHLLRSLCPVTGQPDWATVWVRYRAGRALERASLLRYIVAFRSHQEFHEQCVERMFVDLAAVLEPELLEIQAFYTRRGGLDINPFRSTDPAARPRQRMNRQ